MKRTTKDGETIHLTQITNIHLMNIHKMILKKSKYWMKVRYWTYDNLSEDMYYDEDFIFWKDILNYFNYNNILKEIKKRNLIIKIYFNY